MADAWGTSWGSAWGGSWGGGAIPVVPVRRPIFGNFRKKRADAKADRDKEALARKATAERVKRDKDVDAAVAMWLLGDEP